MKTEITKEMLEDLKNLQPFDPEKLEKLMVRELTIRNAE
jgi:hypothetical protein